MDGRSRSNDEILPLNNAITDANLVWSYKRCPLFIQRKTTVAQLFDAIIGKSLISRSCAP